MESKGMSKLFIKSWLKSGVCLTVVIWRCSITHVPLDKMAAILAGYIFRCISMNEKFGILIEISLKFVPKGAVDNNPALA